MTNLLILLCLIATGAVLLAFRLWLSATAWRSKCYSALQDSADKDEALAHAKASVGHHARQASALRGSVKMWKSKALTFRDQRDQARRALALQIARAEGMSISDFQEIH